MNSSNWFTVDEVLVLFGVWPDFSGLEGPGGGVVRLDPSSVGLSAFDPLVSVSILGLTNVPEASSTSYTGLCTYALGNIIPFTQTVWTSSLFTITTNGLFTAGTVTSNTSVTLSAQYAYCGYLYSLSTNVTVLPLKFAIPRAPINNILVLTLSNGIPDKTNFVQATTNLACANCWVTLLTNVFPGNGVLVTNIPWTNSRGFFRAREFP